MKIFELNNYSFKYEVSDNKAINDISFNIFAGEFVLLCGRTGCGKTTLLRQLKSCLKPMGTASGKLNFCGKPLAESDDRIQAKKIGFVMQDIENQIVTDAVWHELAFGLESLGYPTELIRRRVAEISSFFGIQPWFRKKVDELSGGQKQLLNLAAVMVMRPEVIILDEPTAQLDPIAAETFLNMVSKINSETGITIIMTEHRLEEVFPICSRVIVMDNGSVIYDGKPATVTNVGHAIELPCAARIYAAAQCKGEYPLTVSDGRMWLNHYVKEHNIFDIEEPTALKTSDKVLAEIKDVWFRYSKDQPDAARGIKLKIYGGELLAVVGGNGTGKSTMLSLLCGLNIPYRGQVLIGGKDIKTVDKLYNGIIGMLPQDPKLLFVKKTVYEDLEEVLNIGEDKENKIMGVAKLCGLTELLKSHPYDLSGGERQRAAIAKVLLKRPKILLLDEPTKGMDYEFKRIFASILKSLTSHGTAVVMVSHDIEFCAEYADRCAMFFDGNITSSCDTHEFFKDNSLYTTAARRISTGILDNAVTASDIIYACTGKREDKIPFDIDDKYYYDGNIPQADNKKKHLTQYLFGSRRVKNKDKKYSAKTHHTLIITIIIILITAIFGIYYLDNQKFYFISLLMIAEAMLPVAVSFEKRKPSPREIVTIASMCALSVAGRCVFWFLPEFKPMAALVIISGVVFGSSNGFLIGAVSMFVSNFFFGQGIQTPWQMFAMGMIGFFSGSIFYSGKVSCGRLPLSIFGALAVLIVYGGIVNTCMVFFMQEQVTAGAVIGMLAAGLPFDLTHALSTAVFIWFGSPIIIEKLDRIKAF